MMKQIWHRSSVRKQLSLSPGYLLLVIWLLFLLVTVGWIVAASLSSTGEIFRNNLLKTGLHFETYAKVWINNNVSRYFVNSLLTSCVACVVVVLISAPAAYILGHRVFRGRRTILSMFLTCMSIPGVMIVIPIYGIAARMGLIGNLTTLFVLYSVINVPYTVFFLTGFFSSIPASLEEAAQIDGCSQNRAFWSIVFPMAQPGIITVTIFNFMGIWNEYFMAVIFANSNDNVRTLSVGLQNMINSMKYSGDWAGLFACIVIVFLPTFILYLFLSDRIIAGVTGGAVKG